MTTKKKVKGMAATMNKPKILLPVHPEWCEKIFNGSKTIEVRKTAPKIDTPFEALVYCTKGKPFLYKNPNNGELFLHNNGGYRGGDYEDRYLTGKVIGEFICNKVDLIEYKDECYVINDDIAYTNTIAAKSCLDYDDMYKYLGDKNGYGWHITEPKLFDYPRELSEYALFGKCAEECDEYDICARDYVDGRMSCKYFKRKYLTRAPQSWIYVESV